MSLGIDIEYASAALCVVGGGGIAGWAKYLHGRGTSIRKHLRARRAAIHAEAIQEELAPFLAKFTPAIEQLSPNGGETNSIADRIARIDQRSLDTQKAVEKLDATVIRHLEAHAK